jgi:hypothetical protein
MSRGIEGTEVLVMSKNRKTPEREPAGGHIDVDPCSARILGELIVKDFRVNVFFEGRNVVSKERELAILIAVEMRSPDERAWEPRSKKNPQLE